MKSGTKNLGRWWLLSRARVVALPLLLTLSIPMTACAPPPGEIAEQQGDDSGDGAISSEENSETTEKSSQSLTGAEVVVLYEAANKAYGYFQKAQQLYNFLRGLGTFPRDPLAEIDALRDETRKLETAVMNMSANFDYRLTAVEAKGRDDTVKIQRATSSSALDYARNGSDTVSMAHGAASALEAEGLYFYTAKDRNQPPRFDPRVTVVSFIEAVNNWMAIRAFRRLPNDPYTREQLIRFANRLDFVANNIVSRVNCYDQVKTQTTKVRAKPDSPYYITRNHCRADKFCHDAIEGTTYEREPGYPKTIGSSRACYSYEAHDWRAEAKVQQVGSERYFLNLIQDNAATWRDLARF